MPPDEPAACPAHAGFDPLSAELLATNYLIGNLLRRLLEEPSRWDAVVADPARLRMVEDQELTFHPNISFRGPQTLWVRAGRGEHR